MRRDAHDGDVCAYGRRCIRAPLDGCRVFDVRPDALKWRDDLHVLRANVAGTAAGVDIAVAIARVCLLLAVLANEGDVLACTRERQSRVVVLQQYRAVDDGLHGYSAVRVRGDIGADDLVIGLVQIPKILPDVQLRHGEGVVELPHGVHGGQHTDDLLIHLLLGQLPCLHQLRQLAKDVVRPTHHLNVEPSFGGVVGVVCGPPIADDIALEAELLSQQGLQELLVLTCMRAVDLVVRTHHRARTSFESGCEYGHVDLVLRPVADLDIHRLPVNLLVIVQPMLHRHDDAVVLHFLNEGTNQDASQVRILAGDGLEAAPRQRCACHLDIRPQEDVRSLRDELLCDGLCVNSRGLGGEARSNSQQRRELCRRSWIRLVGVVALRTVVQGQRQCSTGGARVCGLVARQAQLGVDVARIAVAVVGPFVILPVHHRELVLHIHALQVLAGTPLRLPPPSRGTRDVRLNSRLLHCRRLLLLHEAVLHVGAVKPLRLPACDHRASRHEDHGRPNNSTYGCGDKQPCPRSTPRCRSVHAPFLSIDGVRGPEAAVARGPSTWRARHADVCDGRRWGRWAQPLAGA
mmetsp:Transcript_10842/g.38016  ORF Transcript_10842/g.38016 Transcript_10842/m.38016 type:complete len:575 (-) Transcript_10842:97-1821(-)